MENILPKVAVVILNWNGKTLLESFLPSIVATSYPNLQIIVGDNASTDDSVAWLQSNYPLITIIQNTKNYGFAGGYNQILAQVKADYFVLLNSDVEVPVNWISPVVSVMESDPAIAAAQPKIKWQKQKSQFEYAGAAGGFIDTFGFPFCRGRLFDTVEKDSAQYNQPCEVFWASGAALFIKSEAWHMIGGLDADLFAHMEEIDLCWRLKNNGYKIVYCPAAEVYHVGGATLKTESPQKTYLNFRNNLIVMQKNLPPAEAAQKIFARFFIDFVAWLKFLVSGKPQLTLAISKAHLHFLFNVFKNAKKRTKPQLALAKHTGTYQASIVWAYFVKKIRFFSQLDTIKLK